MAPIVSSIEIARPPEEVFSYVTDPSRFAEWQPDVVSVRIEGGRPPSVGSKFTTTRRIGGIERTMTQEITEINPPRVGPLTVSLDHELSQPEGTTRKRRIARFGLGRLLEGGGP